MDHSDSGAIKSPTCMIPLLCAVLFDLIEPFSIITGHAGYKHAILNLLLLALQ